MASLALQIFWVVIRIEIHHRLFCWDNITSNNFKKFLSGGDSFN